MAGVNNILDVAKAIEDGAAVFKDVLADGKITFTDIPRMFSYLSSLKEAIASADEIPGEFADLDSEEISILAAAFWSAALAWIGVVKKK